MCYNDQPHLQRELIALDQDLDGVGHELLRHLQHLVGQRGTHQHHLKHKNTSEEAAAKTQETWISPR
jgi:hypothetical protein